jgi:hypothetical protein
VEGNSVTEEQWTSTYRPDKLILAIHAAASERKRRLFAIACSQRVIKLYTEKLARWHEIAEKLAEGQISVHELNSDDLRNEPYHLARAVFGAVVPNQPSCPRCGENMKTINLNSFFQVCHRRPECHGTRRSPWEVARHVAQEVADRADPSGIKNWQDVFNTESAVSADLVRDIFGNPFRPVAIHRDWLAWNDGTVPKLAQTIYDDRRFDLLPILADALEEAGCDNADILGHCRGPGPHVRGCWVVDLMLGKS